MKLRNLVTSALLAALTCIATIFLKIPLTGAGYIHLGDVFVLAACAFVPMQYAIVAAALGSALADLFGGFVVYAPVTAVVKCVSVVLIRLFLHKKLWWAVLGVVLAALWGVAGYFAFEWAMFGWQIATMDIPFNLLQGGVCGAVALVLVHSLKRLWYRPDVPDEAQNGQ